MFEGISIIILRIRKLFWYIKKKIFIFFVSLLKKKIFFFLMREGVNPATNHRIIIGGASSYITQTMDIHVILVDG